MTTTTESSRAIFAGGCFWCMQAAFVNVEGVLKTLAGYIGGHTEHPTYEQVCRGNTGHYEALEVEFDPKQVGYAELVDWFWHNIDPTDEGGQFADRGTQYYTAIFYLDAEQKKVAEKAKAAIADKLSAKVATAILPVTTFYLAEDYHQNYFSKQTAHYQQYHQGSGRPQCLKELWEK